MKKASKQLKATSTKIGKQLSRILILVNNGYSSLDQEEFKQVVLKCVKNDTSNIDFVISCGIYYYSDGFDSFVIAPFELCRTDWHKEPSEYQAVKTSWNSFLNRHMTRFVTEPDRNDNARLPVLDIVFHVDNCTYVKPTPPFGRKSEFYVNGRPRINSTGIEECPIVARTFPKLSRHAWKLMKSTITDSWKLRESYEEWIRHYLDEEENHSDKLKPLVPINVDFDNDPEARITNF